MIMKKPDTLPHVFTAWGDVLQSLSRAEKVLLGFDFDGTLSPIVERPELAFMEPEWGSLLNQLSSFQNLFVVILSGRSLDDLSKRINLDRVTLAGDHGLRIRLEDGTEYQPEHSETQAELRNIFGQIETFTRDIEGIHLEPKEFSLTIHYRSAPAGTSAILERALKKMLSGTSLRLQSGRMCWEINPDIGWNKGDAFEWIRAQYIGDNPRRFELYVGDDRTDEDVFKKMQTRGFPILVISTEKTGATNANFRLDSQAEVGILLERLMEHISERSTKKSN